jgi:hypothetical protein
MDFRMIVVSASCRRREIPLRYTFDAHSLSPLRGGGRVWSRHARGSRASTCDGMRPATYTTEFIAERHRAQLRVSGLQRTVANRLSLLTALGRIATQI